MRAGSLRQQLETYAATPAPAPPTSLFGLGDRAGADVVRVLWPSGILQAETGDPRRRRGSPAAGCAPAASAGCLRAEIEELDRKPSSCPYLYTWNGERFEFITDFLGGGEMGYWLAPGVAQHAGSRRVRAHRRRPASKPRDGRYELRVTNELEEALFLDRVQLVAVAHPADVEVHPNEGLVPEPRPFTLYSPAPAAAARGARRHGHDVLDRIAHVDRRYADGFALEPIRGYAAEHTLTLTLPPPGPDGRRLLLLTGWTDYAFSGDNVAAHQAGLRLLPPSLEIKDADGRWRTVIDDIGIPVGRPQTVVVDLTASRAGGDTEVRIRTTMRIYWDQILVDTSDGRAPYTVTRLDPVARDSALARLLGRARRPMAASPTPTTTTASRRLAVEAAAGPLHARGRRARAARGTDDMFVVVAARRRDRARRSTRPRCRRCREGWTRTFLLYADGFSKEMNLHSASPDSSAAAAVPRHDAVSLRRARGLSINARASRVPRALQHARRAARRAGARREPRR